MTTNPLDEATASTGVEAMAAIVHTTYGPRADKVLRLQHVQRPTFGTDEVLVRVRAASVDRGTWHIMAGLPYPIRLAGFGVRSPKHLNPGRNFAGTVEAVGADIRDFAVGDEVFGTSDGAFAEYVRVNPKTLATKPSNLSFEEAAAVPVSGITALQAVRDHGQVTSGQHVLIIGASGGVGSFAVQIAKAFGAAVTGVCSTRNVDFVRSLGADHVIDYANDDFADGANAYEVILDIGGNSSLARLRRALAPKGRLIIVGGETDGRLLGGSDRQIRALALSPFISQKLMTFVASENADDLVALRELVEAGDVMPCIDRTYQLSDVPAAIQYLVDGHPKGKVVVSVRDAA